MAATGVGGACGALLRWALGAAAGPVDGFPWPTLTANLLGSVLIGAVAVYVFARIRHPLVWPAVGVGFCGGFTTFSAFAVETSELLRDGELVTASTYTIVSVAGATVLVRAAMTATRRLL